MPSETPHTLPPFVRDVLALYARELRDVRFPDLDLHTLEDAVGELGAAREEAEERRAALLAAEEAVGARESALAGLAERALAYARIYASGNAELAAQLASVHAPHAESAESHTAKKRGRPRKGGGAPDLFTDDAELRAAE